MGYLGAPHAEAYIASSLDEGIRKRTSKEDSPHITTDPFISIGLENAGIPMIHDLLEYNLTYYV